MQFKKDDIVKLSKYSDDVEKLYFDLDKSYKIMYVYGSWVRLEACHEAPFISVEYLKKGES
jgi:hypothetical protein